MGAQQSDGAFYAAAPTAGEAGWAIVFKDPHEEDVAQEDGSTKKITINEATQLKKLMTDLKTPPGGVWLGGKKFNINRTADDEECGEGTCKWAFGMSGKTGVHIVTTGSQILAGFLMKRRKWELIARRQLLRWLSTSWARVIEIFCVNLVFLDLDIVFIFEAVCNTSAMSSSR